MFSCTLAFNSSYLLKTCKNIGCAKCMIINNTILKKTIAYKNTVDSSALIKNVIAIAQIKDNGARTHIRSTI